MIWRRESVLDVYKIAVGLFFFASPWLLAYAGGAARLDAWFSGLLIALLSLAAIVLFARWEEWLSLMAGVWLIVAPWVLGFSPGLATHVSIGAGVAVCFLALIELWLIYFEPDRRQEHPHIGR